MGVITDYLLGDLARPAFLAGRRITKFLRAISQVGDYYAQRILSARDEWTAERATRDALLSLARNANDRGFARENTIDIAAYMLRVIEEHRKKGTTDGLEAQFARMLMPNIEIVTELDLRNAGAVNPFGGNVGFFFILVSGPHPFAATYATWDGGKVFDDPTATWGMSLSPSDQSEIEDVIRRWKPAGTSCRFVVFDDDGTTTWGPLGLSGSYQLLPIWEPWERLPPAGTPVAYYNADFLVP